MKSWEKLLVKMIASSPIDSSHLDGGHQLIVLYDINDAGSVKQHHLSKSGHLFSLVTKIEAHTNIKEILTDRAIGLTLVAEVRMSANLQTLELMFIFQHFVLLRARRKEDELNNNIIILGHYVHHNNEGAATGDTAMFNDQVSGWQARVFGSKSAFLPQKRILLSLFLMMNSGMSLFISMLLSVMTWMRLAICGLFLSMVSAMED